MATIAEQLTSLANTKTAIKDAIVAKGVTVADTDTFRSYADKIGQISGGGGGEPATKFGVPIDGLIGNVDENGILKSPDTPFIFDGTGIKSAFLPYFFYYNRQIEKFLMPDLQQIYHYELQSVCDGGAGYSGVLTTIDLHSVKSVAGYGLERAFYGRYKLTGYIDLNLLEAVGSSGMSSTFYGCPITGFGVDSLNTLDGYAFSGIMSNYSVKVKKILFPSLVTINKSAFGSSYSAAFNGATSLEELHFRMDAQAAVESTQSYSSKFGASNVTIYFDLVGKIVVNGTTYDRSEPNSVRIYTAGNPEPNKTYVAWKDASENIIYTSASTEPAVGTVVYSDQGITQAGTVSEVA